MTDTAGGLGTCSTYIVHYRRTDGTGATGRMTPAGHGGVAWRAPDDCAAITGVEEIGGGGSGSHPLPIGDGEPILSGKLGALKDIARAVTARDAEISHLKADLEELGRAFEYARSKWRAVCGQLAERDAQVARLTAELDDLRQVPVEYVSTRGLQAAMAADPHREDGTLLRETDGEKRAWAWRAATRTWEQVQ